MDIMNIIKTRRSVRKYKNKLPKDSDIRKILEAGSWAPSGLNNQPWRFLVIKDKEKKDKLAGFTKYCGIILNAPLAIIVCMDAGSSYNRDKDLMAIGASIQNMLLEAHSLGLGGCWLGEILNKKEEVEKFLGLDEDLEIVAVITLGYSNEKSPKGTRKKLENLLIKV